MLDAEMIRTLFQALNRELRGMGVTGEVLLCGGAVMCLVFETRKATRDVDGVFRPARQMRKAAAAVAAEFDLPPDWLNDAAKGFFAADPPKVEVLQLSHLRVWAPRAEYMLAMKCVSARWDSHDREDVRFLLRRLKLKTPEAVFRIIEKYYPQERVPAKTRFLLEELLAG